MKPAKALDLKTCCRVRRNLADAYATAARLYAEAVVTLTSDTPSSTPEFTQLHLAAQQAQERTEASRVAFEEHVTRHGC